jgi:hypothetical protein
MDTLKNPYPKVTINLLGNLHQEKTIHVLDEEEEEKKDDGSKEKTKDSETELQAAQVGTLSA